MNAPRTPPVWLVMLPALVLAAVGVRAVTAEMNASQDAARERARSVASRLARSVDALVEEYESPLPRANESLTKRQALDSATYLQSPRALTRDGAGVPLARAEAADPGPVPKSEQALLDDAIATARGLALGDLPVAASGLLQGAATALTHPLARLQLLCAAIEFDPDGAAPIRVLQAAELGLSIPLADRDREARPAAVIALLAAASGARAEPATDGRRVTAKEYGRWRDRGPLRSALDALYEMALENSWGLPDAERERIIDEADRRLSARDQGPPAEQRKDLRRLWEESRRQARSDGPAPTIVQTSGGPVLSVWNPTRIGGRDVLFGGDVPAAVVRTRIGPEMVAIGNERSVRSVRLVGPDGESAFPEPEIEGAASLREVTFGGTRVQHKTAVWALRDIIVEAAPVQRVPGWHAEVVSYPGFEVPTSAWLLAAALAVTTLALIAGLLALRRSAERSARLAEDRQTFLDHVAHELRTPAAAIQALTEELASGHVTREREAVYREHLVRESRRLSTLVEDTLDLTRLDTGRLAFKMEPADLRDVVRRAIEESDGAGRVVAKLPDEAVVVPVDEGALRRAVKNLVENAVRHGGGDAPIAVTLEASNGAASIAVADKGRGIAAEHLPRLFERFFRVPSATHEVKGVGLGLALCREVARAHGGDVGVESTRGKGSTFTMRIPRA